MIGCGIDAGSRAMKVVLMDVADRRVISAVAADQRPDQSELAIELTGQALKNGGVQPRDIKRTVGTGYGRRVLTQADTTITEITCQARGVRSLLPDAQVIVDIGGQDSKVIVLDVQGVRDFAMNDRCAAGTGQFLEMVAQRLGFSLAELGVHAARSLQPAVINSTCAVFAETEIISLLASGMTPEDISAGVLRSVALRVAGLSHPGSTAAVVFTGGAARIQGMDKFLSQALGQPVVIAPDPHLTAARGAALFACEQIEPGHRGRDE